MGKSFKRDTAAAKPLPTAFEGVYLRPVNADILKEFVRMAAEVAPQLQQLAPDEDDLAAAAEVMGAGLDMAVDLGWYLFDNALCDEDGERFEDVNSREDVAGLGIFQVRSIIVAFQEAVFDSGKQ